MPALRALALVPLLLAIAPSLSDAADARPLCFGKRATVLTERGEQATDGDDVIVGQPHGDDIRALGGDDLICGGDTKISYAKDLIWGGAGKDRIAGEEGEDWIFGGRGNDFIKGGPGLNVLDGEQGDDVVRGGSGTDVISARHGDDLLIGGNAPKDVKGPVIDTVGYGMAPRGIHGDIGRRLVTGFGRDELRGIEGLYGSLNHPNTLIGDGGANMLVGGGKDDVIEAGDGNDIVGGRGGNDRIDGGAGVDQLRFFEDENENPPGVEVDLAAGLSIRGPHRASLSGIEDVEGTVHDDVVRGDESDNWLFVMEGDDVVEGRGGDDRLDGYVGADTLDGGDGHDRCDDGEQLTSCEDVRSTYRPD